MLDVMHLYGWCGSYDSSGIFNVQSRDDTDSITSWQCDVDVEDMLNDQDGRHDMYFRHLYFGYGSYVILELYYSYVLRGGVFCNLNVARWMEFVVFSDDVDIDNDIQNDDMVHVKCVLALSCQANVNTQKPSLKVRQYT
eukprot:TRINITY_DN231_c0_g1_i10.p1 TRINITY_DN231_c0_g1~~TRINITY_DN231_c0_g1_i10.p1  ORF type:complete len:139 (-),score=6.76 TRINITY_DN231_c0_g1_i10:22-438(-)